MTVKNTPRVYPAWNLVLARCQLRSSIEGVWAVPRSELLSVPGNCCTHVKCSLLFHLGRRSLTFKRLRTQIYILRTARNAQGSMHRVGARGVLAYPAPPFGLSKSNSIPETIKH